MKMTGLVFQAFWGLIAYDVMLMLGKFKTVRSIVGRWVVKPRTIPGESLEQIVQAINIACICYPKQVLCLQRSSVTTCLLRHHGVAAQMVLGAQKTPFAAHAWTEVNSLPINERSNVQARYTVWERC